MPAQSVIQLEYASSLPQTAICNIYIYISTSLIQQDFTVRICFCFHDLHPMRQGVPFRSSSLKTIFSTFHRNICEVFFYRNIDVSSGWFNRTTKHETAKPLTIFSPDEQPELPGNVCFIFMLVVLEVQNDNHFLPTEQSASLFDGDCGAF